MMEKTEAEGRQPGGGALRNNDPPVDQLTGELPMQPEPSCVPRNPINHASQMHGVILRVEPNARYGCLQTTTGFVTACSQLWAKRRP